MNLRNIFILLLIGLFHKSYGQERSMGPSQIFDRFKGIIELAEKHNHEVVRVEADIIRTEKTCYRNLDPSYTYTIVACASKEIEDIDLTVYKAKGDDEWELVDFINKSESVYCTSMIKPAEYSMYKFIVTVKKWKSPDKEVGHYALVFSHD